MKITEPVGHFIANRALILLYLSILKHQTTGKTDCYPFRRATASYWQYIFIGINNTICSFLSYFTEDATW